MPNWALTLGLFAYSGGALLRKSRYRLGVYSMRILILYDYFENDNSTASRVVGFWNQSSSVY